MARGQPVLPIFTSSMMTIPSRAYYISGVWTPPNSQNTENWFSNKYSIINTNGFEKTCTKSNIKVEIHFIVTQLNDYIYLNCQSKETGKMKVGGLSERVEAKGNKFNNNHSGTFSVRRGCPVSLDIPHTETDSSSYQNVRLVCISIFLSLSISVCLAIYSFTWERWHKNLLQLS